jgi:hypothetical protein
MVYGLDVTYLTITYFQTIFACIYSIHPPLKLVEKSKRTNGIYDADDDDDEGDPVNDDDDDAGDNEDGDDEDGLVNNDDDDAGDQAALEDEDDDQVDGWDNYSNEPKYSNYYTIYDNIEYFIRIQDKQFYNIKEIYDYVIDFYLTHSLLINPDYINNVINTIAIQNGFISKNKLFFDYFYYEPEHNANYEYNCDDYHDY